MPVCVYVCHNISNLLQTFAQLAFVVLLYPPPLAATHNAVLNPAHRTFEPRCDAYVEKQWVRYVPGLVGAWPLQEEQHWLVSGRGRKPGSGNGRQQTFASLTSVFSSSSSPSFFVNKYREATTGIARLWMGDHRGTRRLENFLKDLKFLLFCKIDEVICLAIAHKLCVPMFFTKNNKLAPSWRT